LTAPPPFFPAFGIRVVRHFIKFNVIAMSCVISRLAPALTFFVRFEFWLRERALFFVREKESELLLLAAQQKTLFPRSGRTVPAFFSALVKVAPELQCVDCRAAENLLLFFTCSGRPPQ